jgi:hypothetical protein
MAKMNTYERAVQIYQVLISAAHHRQLLTYDIVGKLIGVPRQGLAPHLEHPLNYCVKNKLPALTSICVSAKTGQPSHGFTDRQPMTPETLHEEREAVYAHEWYRDLPLTAGQLENSST